MKMARYRIEQRNKFSVGEEIEVMKPDGENRTVTVRAIVDEEGNAMESAPHPQQVLFIDLGEPLERYDILTKKRGGTAMMEGKYVAYVGTYTHENSVGIHIYDVDELRRNV